jgi:uncharacterized protein YPO0396
MRSLPEHIERALIIELYRARDEIKAEMQAFHQQFAANIAMLKAELDRLDVDVAELVEMRRDFTRRVDAIRSFRQSEHDAEPPPYRLN